MQKPIYKDKIIEKVVIKLGTGILTSEIGKLNMEVIGGICDQIHRLREQGVVVYVVSSAAVGLGMGRMGLKKRPTDLPTLQACAAVGQSILIETWQKAFDPSGITVGQMLLTRDDLKIKKRHTAVRDTLDRMLKSGVIPIINENDSISADEIKFGDNDVLSALVASLTKADLLFILSTAPGLYDLAKNERIPVVEEITPEIEQLAGGTQSATAVGGMISKIDAAKIASSSNCGMFIADGSIENVIFKLIAGEPMGTYFEPGNLDLTAHKRWLAFFDKSAGRLYVDSGAETAIKREGSSLLAKGITHYEGTFLASSLVSIVNPDGLVIAKGLCRYSSYELEQVLGKRNHEIQAIFPDKTKVEVVHRDSLALMTVA